MLEKKCLAPVQKKSDKSIWKLFSVTFYDADYSIKVAERFLGSAFRLMNY